MTSASVVQITKYTTQQNLSQNFLNGNSINFEHFKKLGDSIDIIH